MIEPTKRQVVLDVEAIAVHYKVAVGTVRRWASEDHWPSYGTHRRQMWDLNDAQRSYLNRRPELDNATTSGEHSD